MTAAANGRAAVGAVDAQRAFRMARRRFVAAEKLDMQELAADVGVDRSTLFRWVGNREQLIANILVSMTRPAIEAADRQSSSTGGTRIAAAAYHYSQSLIDSDFFQAYIKREADRALRLLTSRSSPVQRSATDVFERMIEQERDRGNLTHAMDSADLAYLIVRIIESFVYADSITGDAPDATKIRTSVGALLHVDA